METTEQLKEQIEALQQQIKEQEKLASLGLLTAGIVHEIRNPLNFVINFSKLSDTLIKDLADDIDDNADKISSDDMEDIEDSMADLKENIAKIREHGERATSIIQNILQYSRGKEGLRIPTNINALVHEYVWLGYHAMRANYNGFNASIKEQYDDTLTDIAIVPQDISRAILNVVNNAFYAIWERANIEGEQYHPELQVTTSSEGEMLRLRFDDNGGGMTDEVKQKLYDNFFTTKPVGQGTGLGMAITLNIIHQHGGRIEFDSTIGSGSSFSLIIPINKK